MSLFQKSVLNKYVSGIEKKQVDKAWEEFKKLFHNKERQQIIRDANEEKYQSRFLNDLFVKVLGYTQHPDPNHNLVTEKKNETDSGKADGALLDDGKVKAVIELKGTNTVNLDKIVNQAFGYQSKQSFASYVIVSNYEKLRFYIDKAVDYEEFDLFELSKDRFKVLWLCLEYSNFKKDIPKRIKDSSLVEEEQVTKKLYKNYSDFRMELHQDLIERNPDHDKLILFQKTQKLLDRFLFIFFAEDRGLIPPNFNRKIIREWTELRDEYDVEVSLYDRFKKNFDYLNKGYKGKEYQVFAYNGGLFQQDELLDELSISDEVLYKYTDRLSEYDFDSEVDVNILGHIFEHSLNEIEEINAELKGEEVDTSKTRRKKDGVFYTPKYITKYIVEHTVGKLCEEQKAALDIDDEDYRSNRQKKTKKELLAKLEKYREWLLGLTICDPACGSGAFLNQALEFLIAEHTSVDELQAKLLGESMVLQDIENQILDRNLFGVDINEESVEIAKLSLWLRTAEPGRKLTSLNHNIKCGNSLIDDYEVAGDKAFDWEAEFPSVFENGGFDVVIGNPPYVGEKGHTKIFDDLKRIPKWNDFYRRRSNTYYFFIKHGLDLMSDGGFQSLIVPREFINADWSNNVRESVLSNSKIEGIVDFLETKVFEDAGTTSLILTQRKVTEASLDYQFDFYSVSENKLTELDFIINRNPRKINVGELDLSGVKPWDFYQLKLQLSDTIKPLGDLFDVSQGLVTGSDKITKKHIVAGLAQEDQLGRGIFILREGIDIKHSGADVLLKINNDWLPINGVEQKYIKEYLKTESLQKWVVEETDTYVIYVGSEKLQGIIKDYLMEFAPILLNRSTTIGDDEVITLEDFENFTLDEIKAKYSSAGAVQKIMRRKKWWLPLYERESIPFEGPKILVNTKNMDRFTLSLGEHYSSGGGAGGQNYIYPKPNAGYFSQLPESTSKAEYVMFTNAVLNSSLIQKYINDGFYNQLSTSKIKDLPIVKVPFENDHRSATYASIITNCYELPRLLIEIQGLTNTTALFFNSKFQLEEGNGFDNWLGLDSVGFLAELKKKKVKLSLEEEAEWLTYFNKKKTEINALKAEIDRIDKHIDQMVYELYGLSEEEIQIVESAYNSIELVQ